MRLKILISTIGLYGLITCYGQQENLDDYYENYVVKQISDLSDFYKLDESEMRLDSILPTGDIKNNRSRVFMDSYKNGKVQRIDTAFYKGLPTPCNCNIENDTTFIKMEIGFFGGLGFTIKIYENSFESGYFEYTDDVRPYKTKLTDTAFYSQIQIDNQYQMLILKEKPTQKKDQQITGLLTYWTKKFYIKNYSDSMDTVFSKGKIYFTCKTTDTTTW